MRYWRATSSTSSSRRLREPLVSTPRHDHAHAGRPQPPTTPTGPIPQPASHRGRDQGHDQHRDDDGVPQPAVGASRPQAPWLNGPEPSQAAPAKAQCPADCTIRARIPADLPVVAAIMVSWPTTAFMAKSSPWRCEAGLDAVPAHLRDLDGDEAPTMPRTGPIPTLTALHLGAAARRGHEPRHHPSGSRSPWLPKPEGRDVDPGH